MKRPVLIVDPIEKMVGDLSPYLSTMLNSLGFLRYRLEKEDLLQEIRIKIWQVYKGKHRDIQLNKAYIKKVVYSVLIDEINRAKKDRKILQSAETYLIQDQAASKGSQLPDELLKDDLLASIGELKESKQLVIRLRLEGFSIGEIAGLNNWTYRKTCLILYRAIRELKSILSRRGIYYEG